MARVLVCTLGYCLVISSDRAVSFEAVRDTRTMLNFDLASCNANSLPRPSEAPVTTAQLPGGPNERSYSISVSFIIWERDRRLRFHTGLPGSTNRLRSTRTNVNTLHAMTSPPVARRNRAPKVGKPGAIWAGHCERHSVYFERSIIKNKQKREWNGV